MSPLPASAAVALELTNDPALDARLPQAGDGKIYFGSIVSLVGVVEVQTGWLLCNGASLLRADYPELFAAIGAAFGAADALHFNLPPNGVIFVGAKAGTFAARGATGGAETVTLAESEIPAHDHPHSLTLPDHGHSGSGSASVSHDAARLGGLNAWPNGNVLARNAGTPDGYDAYEAGGASISVGVSVSVAGVTSTPAINGAVGNAGGGGAHNNLQPYSVAAYLIYTGGS